MHNQHPSGPVPHARPSSALAWKRFRRIMLWMALAALLSIAAALWWLHWVMGPMPWAMIGAVVLGVGLSVLLGTALMGLIFLSANSGHDDDVDRFKDELAKERTRP